MRGTRTLDAVSSALTPALAQEIASETSAIIGHNVIITDVLGRVWGSGDERRLGSLHEASLGVVASQVPETHDEVAARSMRGVLPGVTFPLVHEGAVIGTVGITGAPEQVERFGALVRRQTEILLNESDVLRSRMTRERVIEGLLRDLLHASDADLSTEIVERADDFALDLALPRRAVALQVELPEERDAGPTASGTVLRAAREAFRQQQDLCAALTPRRWVVLTTTTDLTVLRRRHLDRMSLRLRQLHRQDVAVGIGGTFSAAAGETNRSYLEALQVLHLRRRRTSVEQDAPAIEDFRLEQLLTAIPPRLRVQCLHPVVAALRTGRDWSSDRATVIAWVESGFTLVAAADRLGVHRNTLVNRLRRISAAARIADEDRRGWLTAYLGCLAEELGPQAAREAGEPV